MVAAHGGTVEGISASWRTRGRALHGALALFGDLEARKRAALDTLYAISRTRVTTAAVVHVMIAAARVMIAAAPVMTAATHARARARVPRSSLVSPGTALLAARIARHGKWEPGVTCLRHASARVLPLHRAPDGQELRLPRLAAMAFWFSFWVWSGQALATGTAWAGLCLIHRPPHTNAKGPEAVRGSGYPMEKIIKNKAKPSLLQIV